MGEMAEAATQWARHAAYTSSRAAQAAQYAAQQAMSSTTSAQNAVAQVNFLLNHPDIKAAAEASAEESAEGSPNGSEGTATGENGTGESTPTASSGNPAVVQGG